MTYRSDKPTLSEFLNEKLYTLEEALDILGWSYNRSDDEDTTITEIKCCGQLVVLVGIAGVDYGYCEICGKGVCDMTGMIPLKPHVVGMIEPEKYHHPCWVKWKPFLESHLC